MYPRRRAFQLAAGAIATAVVGPDLMLRAAGPASARPVEPVGNLGDGQPTRWGMAMPGIVSSFRPSGRQLALTFDACAGAYDAALIATLVRYRVPATLFLNSRWIDANPRTASRLAADPLFEIGNHGTRHVPLSVTGRSAYGIAGTRSPHEVVAEVATNHRKLTALLGRAPQWFRTGTAHYDDVAVRIVRSLGEIPVGFTDNGDGGATESAEQVKHNLLAATPGTIVLSHMNHPRAGTSSGYAEAIPQMLASGWQFVGLSQATGRRQPLAGGFTIPYL